MANSMGLTCQVNYRTDSWRKDVELPKNGETKPFEQRHFGRTMFVAR